MTECTQKKYNILKSSLDNTDVTVLTAKHAVRLFIISQTTTIHWSLHGL